MTILEMLQQSAILTLLGMTVVFVFLWVMIICVSLTGRLIHRMGWDKDLHPQKSPAASGAQNISPEIVAAISAALTEHRKQNKREAASE
ncbi:MAG: OadG family protein [Spirochaetaceae bacterium]|jgi:oxaloacetate decarboxylase gamma subunit|nr:OadG family protein [Spirochaetaceae bacterium]